MIIQIEKYRQIEVTKSEDSVSLVALSKGSSAEYTPEQSITLPLSAFEQIVEAVGREQK